MRALAAACLLFALSAPSVHAREGASPGSRTSVGREQLIDYRDGRIVTLRVALRHPLTVRLPSGEKVLNAIVSDAAGWQVTTNRGGDRLLVEPLTSQVYASLAVTTNRRSYTFSLLVALAGAANLPAVVRLRYSPPLAPSPNMPPSVAGIGNGTTQMQYRIRGDAALRPTSVSDDGARTYIDWPPDVSLPAVYTLDDAGREALTNGNMRGGQFVIDSVERHLVFRLDKRSATAVRISPREAGR